MATSSHATAAKATATEPWALLEWMPDCHRARHREAANWGLWPANGSIRDWVPAAEAAEIVARDEDGYASIVRTAQILYRVIASRPIGDGRHESLCDAATLGDEMGELHVSRDEAEIIAAAFQAEIDDLGLDPETVYGVDAVLP